MTDSLISVALRVRPLVASKGCQTCLATFPDQAQVQILGTDKAFTFNYVFGPNDDQQTFYNSAIKGMIDNLFLGYNVTILAYGQTGSGKTYSMGTCYTEGAEEMGIIPRAIKDLFKIVEKRTDSTFEITVSFMELYHGQLYDLLSNNQRDNSIVDIREDAQGIKIPGLTEIRVSNSAATLLRLTEGSAGRATGATSMNTDSSRSHAIFTVNIHEQKKDNMKTATTAKFHLVDLAGSERNKKSKATGERFKESININKGLLALGNVISQLGETQTGKSRSHIAYRDSKLTRFLQDSLGGNSLTLMIACVSPADNNLDETISTLRYADRARKIKNQPIVNQDPHEAEVNRLNKLIQELRLSILAEANTEDGESACPPEHKELQNKVQSLQARNRDLTEELNLNLIEFLEMNERADLAETSSQTIRKKITELLMKVKEMIDNLDVDNDGFEEHRSTLRMIYNKLLELQTNQSKTVTIEKQDAVEEEEAASNFADGDSDLDVREEEHTMQQAERKDQVKSINRELALKEDLVSRLMENSAQMEEYSKERKAMKKKIEKLEAKKDDLEKDLLVSVQSNSESSKNAEALRQQVEKLERKIAELGRKREEQKKLIKIKEKSDVGIKNLMTEIHSMKNDKTKLMRLIKTKSEKFTQWKLAREQELRQLNIQDRKQQHQIVKMEIQHTNQQKVLKRKMEKACAVNKRLKEALEKQVQPKSGNTVGIQAYVTQEIEVLTSTIDAERSLERLMQDRALLTSTLTKIKANREKYDDEATYENEISEHEKVLQMRNAQIADLQQKILASDQENKRKTRWNIIQSMADTKTALKTVFDVVAETKRSQYAKSDQFDELIEENDSLRKEIHQIEFQQKEALAKQQELVAKLREQESKMRVEHEETVNDLLGQLRRVSTRLGRNANPKSRFVRENESLISLSDVSSVEDDVNNDPDWRISPHSEKITLAVENNIRVTRSRSRSPNP